MKKSSFLFLPLFFISCGSMYYPSGSTTGNGGNSGYGTTTNADPNSVSPEVEQEFQSLNKEYKQDTKALLSDLLNDDSKSPTAAIVVENTSPCNIVLTIKGVNYLKKIPIGAGQTRGTIVKKDTYRLSAQVCQGNYDEVKFVDSSVSMKLNNKQ